MAPSRLSRTLRQKAWGQTGVGSLFVIRVTNLADCLAKRQEIMALIELDRNATNRMAKVILLAPSDFSSIKERTDDGTIKIFSRIDSPGHYQTLRGPEHTFRGIAFGGPNSISKVEISLDAGRTWNDCRIEPPMSPYSWVIWSYTWRPPKPGKFQTVVRAIDTKGQLQIAEIVRPQSAGASGYHTIVSEVEQI